MAHLCRRAFEDAAAAARKQRVTAEEQGFRAAIGLCKGDVAHGVSRHMQHLELQAQHFNVITVVHGLAGLWHRVQRRPVDRAAQPGSQRVHAADMVGVAVRH
jgi:hypothetical protein